MVVSREAIERSMTIVTLFADSLLLHSYCQDYSQVLRIDCFLIELSALAAYENDAAAPFIKTPGLESKICRFALIDYRWLSFRTDLLCFSALLVRMVREKERGKFVALYSDCLHTCLVPIYPSRLFSLPPAQRASLMVDLLGKRMTVLHLLYAGILLDRLYLLLSSQAPARCLSLSSFSFPF